MKKITNIFILFSILLFLCTSCSLNIEKIPMPYGTDDYDNGEWTLEKVTENLNEQGFDEIEIVEYESRGLDRERIKVKIEDYSNGSLLTEYKSFKKGELFYTYEKIKIEVYKPIPVLNINNCPELGVILSEWSDLEGDVSVWKPFMEEHNGEYIEFNGKIVDCFDEFYYITDLTLTISFENYENITFCWDGISTNEVGYQNNYSVGCIEKNTPVHVVAKITCTDDIYRFELESVDLKY